MSLLCIVAYGHGDSVSPLNHQLMDMEESENLFYQRFILFLLSRGAQCSGWTCSVKRFIILLLFVD